MSALPDERTDSFITIPAQAQQDLCDALTALCAAHPEFISRSTWTSSMWERSFVVSAEGGAFLAAMIDQALKQGE